MVEIDFPSLQERLSRYDTSKIQPSKKRTATEDQKRFLQTQKDVDLITEGSGAEGLVYMAAIIMLLGAMGVSRIAKASGWKKNDIQYICRNFYESGIWSISESTDYKIILKPCGWMDNENDEQAWLGFWMDAAVGAGELTRDNEMKFGLPEWKTISK